MVECPPYVFFFKADKYLGMRWTALEKCVHTIE